MSTVSRSTNQTSAPIRQPKHNQTLDIQDHSNEISQPNITKDLSYHGNTPVLGIERNPGLDEVTMNELLRAFNATPRAHTTHSKENRQRNINTDTGNSRTHPSQPQQTATKLEQSGQGELTERGSSQTELTPGDMSEPKVKANHAVKESSSAGRHRQQAEVQDTTNLDTEGLTYIGIVDRSGSQADTSYNSPLSYQSINDRPGLDHSQVDVKQPIAAMETPEKQKDSQEIQDLKEQIPVSADPEEKPIPEATRLEYPFSSSSIEELIRRLEAEEMLQKVQEQGEMSWILVEDPEDQDLTRTPGHEKISEREYTDRSDPDNAPGQSSRMLSGENENLAQVLRKQLDLGANVPSAGTSVLSHRGGQDRDSSGLPSIRNSGQEGGQEMGQRGKGRLLGKEDDLGVRPWKQGEQLEVTVPRKEGNPRGNRVSMGGNGRGSRGPGQKDRVRQESEGGESHRRRNPQRTETRVNIRQDQTKIQQEGGKGMRNAKDRQLGDRTRDRHRQAGDSSVATAVVSSDGVQGWRIGESEHEILSINSQWAAEYPEGNDPEDGIMKKDRKKTGNKVLGDELEKIGEADMAGLWPGGKETTPWWWKFAVVGDGDVPVVDFPDPDYTDMIQIQEEIRKDSSNILLEGGGSDLTGDREHSHSRGQPQGKRHRQGGSSGNIPLQVEINSAHDKWEHTEDDSTQTVTKRGQGDRRRYDVTRVTDRQSAWPYSPSDVMNTPPQAPAVNRGPLGHSLQEGTGRRGYMWVEHNVGGVTCGWSIMWVELQVGTVMNL